MPCCGLHEHRQRVPMKYTLAGGLVFWGAFLAALTLGLATCWSARGRWILRTQAGFIRSLWIETMRQHDSIPARLSCRLSGRVLHFSPRLAEMIYRHPEVPFVYAPVLAVLLLACSGVWLVRLL